MELFQDEKIEMGNKDDINIHEHQFLHTACCFGYYHGISLVYWTRFVKTRHV